jgi:hypothetical protein
MHTNYTAIKGKILVLIEIKTSEDYLQTNKELYQVIASIISAAVWINGLKKAGYINTFI